uniref:Pollen Ole e 1 allergen and extensin family protein n=1 Tax=Oryza punctata TaxID=4537 RepID=A0A0E0M6E2_ORYPU
MQLLLLLLAAVFVAAKPGSAISTMPMELYFTPGELARIAGYGEEPVSTVVVSGQVTCELCICPGSDLLAFQLPGAKVEVACETEGPNTQANSVFTATDEFGNFTLHLPSRLHATPSLENACVVKVLQLPPESACGGLRHRPAAFFRLRPSSSLSSSVDGVRAYTAGVIRLQHGGTPSGEHAGRGQSGYVACDRRMAGGNRAFGETRRFHRPMDQLLS